MSSDLPYRAVLSDSTYLASNDVAKYFGSVFNDDAPFEGIMGAQSGTSVIPNSMDVVNATRARNLVRLVDALYLAHNKGFEWRVCFMLACSTLAIDPNTVDPNIELEYTIRDVARHFPSSLRSTYFHAAMQLRRAASDAAKLIADQERGCLEDGSPCKFTPVQWARRKDRVANPSRMQQLSTIAQSLYDEHCRAEAESRRQTTPTAFARSESLIESIDEESPCTGRSCVGAVEDASESTPLPARTAPSSAEPSPRDGESEERIDTQ